MEDRELAAGCQGAATLALCRLGVCGRRTAGNKGPQPERIKETLLIEWPQGESAPTRYWLARLPKKKAALAKLVATAGARGRVEQDDRELKDELGLDHYEGRSWQGFHHPLALVTAAFFLRQEQRRAQKNRTLPTLPQVRRSLQATLIHLSGRCPWCHTRFHPPDPT